MLKAQSTAAARAEFMKQEDATEPLTDATPGLQ